MPHHEHHYNDMYWDDMPEAAHKAATILGYTKESWDADSEVPYDTKSFFECTNAEKQSAMFLNLSPIKKKLNVWWEDLDQATKDQAQVLGWTQEKWDDDWEIEHLDIDKLYWADLDTKQQAAANHFGYTKATWDETWNAEDFNPAGGATKPAAAAPGKKPNVIKPLASTADASSSSAPTESAEDKPVKKFTPPPKGKVFTTPHFLDQKDEKKDDDDDHRKFIKPFKKLFGRD